jgi:hypothetical protein
MPRIVYGLLEGMISHRISSPDPGALVGEDGMPDACTSCHVDETRAWAAAAMPSLGLRGTPALEGAESSPRVHLDLVGGDPLQRNLAAHALARPHATSDWRARAGLLVYALDDEYASVRWFARQGLRELIERDADADARETTLALVEAFDYVGAPEARAPIVALLARRFGPGPLADNPELREELERARDQKAIWIGE